MSVERDILSLHDSGLCIAAIAIRLGLDLATVRSTLGRQVVQRSAALDPKAHQAAVESHRKQLLAAKRAKAIQKRDKALAAIAALQAELDSYTRS